MATASEHAIPVELLEEDEVDFAEEPDPIRSTADDRPNTTTLPARPDPAADHGDSVVTRRREDIEEKHRRVVDYLDATRQDALILGRADSVAWFTSGGDLGQDLGSELSSILIFVNRTSRAVVTDNVQSARVFEEELAGLGFQLKERIWHDDPGRIIAELSHNKRVETDVATSPGPWPKDQDGIRSLRRRLTALERQRLRVLGRTLTLAVEATCRNFVRDEKEADVAGHLAHRLIREGVVPVDLRVVSDARQDRFRQASFKDAKIGKRATITVTGRRHGLCASVSRTVSFGPADAAFRGQHLLAGMVDATCIYFSRPGEPVAEVFRRARRIYEKFGRPHEWTLDYIGSLIGYLPREALLVPDSPVKLGDDMAVCWCPSVGPARSSDTIVVDSRGGYEVVTEAQNWPKIDVSVKGYVLPRPGILER